MKNSIPNPRVRNLISGRDSYISAVSQCASIPTNVLREGIRIDVSSTLKTMVVRFYFTSGFYIPWPGLGSLDFPNALI